MWLCGFAQAPFLDFQNSNRPGSKSGPRYNWMEAAIQLTRRLDDKDVLDNVAGLVYLVATWCSHAIQCIGSDDIMHCLGSKIQLDGSSDPTDEET